MVVTILSVPQVAAAETTVESGDPVIDGAKTANRPVEKVADLYEQDKDKGWGATAKEMSIKPGSAELHEIKANSWGRYSEDEMGKSEGKGKC